MKEDRLIIALDLVEPEKALKLADLLSPYVTTFKIGWQLFLSGGEKIVKSMRERGEVFLDLKLFDIPFQVAKAVEALSRFELRFLTVSLFGGFEMVKEAVEASKNFSREGRLTLLGVTVLTSLEKKDLVDLGIKSSPEKSVLNLAKMGYEAGLRGLVASSREARLIKERISQEIKVVTPGIRLGGEASGDQKRVSTVEEALKAGADFLVVGRPITGDKDPLKKLQKYLEEIAKWKA